MATKSRKLAEKIEMENRYGSNFSSKSSNNFLEDSPKTQAVFKGLSSGVKEIARIPQAISRMDRTPRSDEDMSELTREVNRAINSREQYESERAAGDPNALRLSFAEWKKL
jgi:hypothetical protein